MTKTLPAQASDGPLSADLLRRIDAYWRAANYLSVGQIYFKDNALLKEPLTLAHVKPRLLGHWGTTPGLNFIYVHLNRIIRQYDAWRYGCGADAGARPVPRDVLRQNADARNFRIFSPDEHVRGFKEEGTTTTPFDMTVLNDLDRYHLAGDVIDRVPGLGVGAAKAKQYLADQLTKHKAYIDEHGEDMPEIRNWRWRGGTTTA